jgi:hypothetical protein
MAPMAFTSDRPITVDGVRLDTLAWNIEKVSRETAARRASDVSLPNVDGSLPSLNDALEPISFGLQMWLRGTDADGAVPAPGSRTRFRENLDELLHLFGKRHALLDVREVVDGSGTERRALAKVTASIAPEENVTGSAGVFSVALSIPAGVWEDAATADWTTTGAAITAAEVTTLRGATERINDAVVLVTGPANNPRVTDPATGMWVQLSANLAAGQFWRFSSATWASRYGAGLGLGSADTTGTDGSAITSVGGPPRPYMLPLVPVRDTGARRVRATLSATSGMTSSTALSVRARRKYA